MAGALDTAFKAIAKSVVADLGTALDTSITYVRKTAPSYDIDTGAVTTTDTSYSSIKVPIEFIRSDEENGYQENTARVYVTPNLIGNNQPSLQDEISLTFAGSSRVAKLQDVVKTLEMWKLKIHDVVRGKPLGEFVIYLYIALNKVVSIDQYDIFCTQCPENKS